MNAMLYVRGRPLDYDGWEAQGAPGLGLRGRAARTSSSSEDNVRGASEYHGAGGPLRVSEQRSPRPLNRRLLAASEAAGIPRIADYNGPEQDGVSMFQVTQQNGRRFSAADAYLRPALTRPNLEVRTNVTVLGVELEGERAVGRAPAQGPRRRGARARRARGGARAPGRSARRSCCCCRDRRRPRSCAAAGVRGPPRASRASGATSRTTRS